MDFCRGFFLVLLLCPMFSLAAQLKLSACSGNRTKINKGYSPSLYGCREKSFKPEETALVLVDMWNEQGKTDEKIVKFLEKLREKKFFVIHGHGDAVLNHPKYQELRAEVMAYLGDEYCRGESGLGSSQRQALYSYRVDSTQCKDKKRPGFSQEISVEIAPPLDRKREYVVRYEDEMRYVLWKNGIRNLIYVGGALDECMLHRAYGINALVGTDGKRANLNIIVMKDMIDSLPPIMPITAQFKNNILLESFSQKLIKISSSDSVRFEGP